MMRFKETDTATYRARFAGIFRRRKAAIGVEICKAGHSRHPPECERRQYLTCRSMRLALCPPCRSGYCKPLMCSIMLITACSHSCSKPAGNMPNTNNNSPFTLSMACTP